MHGGEESRSMGFGTGSIDVSAMRRTRRAIVFADLVESVRLMHGDEADAIDRWRRFATSVREQLLPAKGARLIRTAGDGLLIEAPHAGPAVSVALALHEAIDEHNHGRDASARMLLRIGINVADVVFDEYEAYGAGVNLAQRLCSLARPGGTVVSAEVRDGIADGVQAEIEDLGLRYVKHLDEPIRAFALHAPTTGADTAAARQTASPQQDLRPMIAVVPFMAMPADPGHDAIGHAMADDIIATLSRHPGLRVVSRMSTAAVRDITGDLPRLRALLGASFALSGRFYVRGNRIRLSAELSELRDGSVLWTGNHHAAIDDLFEGRDELVPQLVAQVTQQVLAHELARVRSLPMSSLASFSLFLGASGLLNSLVPADHARAHEVLSHLEERHPRQALLQAMLSNWHLFRLLQGWTGDAERESQHLLAHANRAMELDPEHPDALLAQGEAQIFAQRDFPAAHALFLKALQANPQHPMVWARLSEAQRVAGDADGARHSAEQALALSPLDPRRFIFESFAASAALETHRYADAQLHARASLRRHTLFAPPHLVLICALWMQEQHQAARDAAADCLRCIPGITVSGRTSARKGTPSLDTPFARALLGAGIPP